jgi:hypothetical protein
MRHLLISLVTGLLLAMPGHAAQLLTDGSGYAGPVIDIGHVPAPGYYFGNGPFVFGAVTITGTHTFGSTVFGQPFYGFGTNGMSVSQIMIGSGLSDAAIVIDFATPVAVFGAGMNYAPGLVGTGFPFPTLPASIAAFDVMGGLIADYDLEALAPIDAAGQNDVFAFRGIDGQGQGISRFVLSGAYIGMRVNGSATLGPPPPPPPPVPEPGSWALLLAGFGLLGLAARWLRQPRATA